MTARKVGKEEMEPFYKLLFKLVNKCLLSHSKRRHEEIYRDLAAMEVLDQNRPISLPSLMLKHMARPADQELGTHVLPYGFV